MVDLIIVVFIVFSFAAYDWFHLNIKKKYIDSHVLRWCLRFISIIIFSKLDITVFIGMSLFFASTFDSILNLMRGIDLFYLGNRAYWDMFWKRIPYIYIVFKIIALFVGVYLLLL